MSNNKIIITRQLNINNLIKEELFTTKYKQDDLVNFINQKEVPTNSIFYKQLYNDKKLSEFTITLRSQTKKNQTSKY